MSVVFGDCEGDPVDVAGGRGQSAQYPGAIMTSRHYLDTGQRTCHGDDGREVLCEGSGQDASFAVGTSWPEPRFEVSDVMVMDRLTGLMWCRSANLAEFPLTWQEALDFVATMNREQHFGWRD